MSRYLALMMLLCGLAACKMPVPQYQRIETMPSNAWSYNNKPKFTFNIKDTTGRYVPYFIVRHTQGYPYCNMWVLFYIKTPGDTLGKRERINITMAESSGKWLGKGMGEIYEERVKINFGDSVKLNKAGTYEIVLEQNMRIDPLPEVMQIGLRVEDQSVHGKR